MKKRSAVMAILVLLIMLQLSGCSSNQGTSKLKNTVGMDATSISEDNFAYRQKIIDTSGLSFNDLVIADDGYYMYGAENGESSFYFSDLSFSGFSNLDYHTDAVILQNTLNVNNAGNPSFLEYAEIETEGTSTETCFMKEIDKSGAVIKETDLSYLYDSGDATIIGSLITKSGNLLINCLDQIILLDTDGQIIKKRDTGRVMKQAVRSAAGELLICGQGENGYSVEVCDWDTLEVKNTYVIDYNFTDAIEGEGSDVYFTDASNLYSYDIKTETVTTILNWVDCGMKNAGKIVALDKECFAGLTAGKPYLLEKQKIDGEIINITLATFNMNNKLREAVIGFNGTSDKYKITVNDYSVYNTSENDSAGLLKLNTEIIAGTVPDIIDMSQLPAQKYISNGLLENLSPYLDGIMSDLFENIVNSQAINGGVYELVPWFSIFTVAGSPMVVGAEPDWNLSEFYETVETNKQYETVFGKSVTAYDFLGNVLMFNSDDYINWEEKTCNFMSEDFIRLLEFAADLPADNSVGRNSQIAYVEDDLDIYTGKQMLMTQGVCDIGDLSACTALYKDSFVFKGFPTSEGSGSVCVPDLDLGMSSVTKSKDGVWEFFEYLLSEDLQDGLFYSIPIRKASADKIFEKRLEELKDLKGMNIIDPNTEDFMSVELRAPNEKDTQIMRSLINSVDTMYKPNMYLNEIVYDEASYYFAGQKSAEECAKLIQNRVGIYLSEQG